MSAMIPLPVPPDWSTLQARLFEASGPEATLDAQVARAFDVPVATYTASAETCRRLALQVLPDWHLHVGFSASGVMPQAVLTRNGTRAEAEAPTVPLAVLRAMVRTRCPMD